MGPLMGWRVVVCRPVDQAGPLVDLLEAQGAQVVSAPVIRIVDPPDGGKALRAALGNLRAGDWLVVTSPNGAKRASRALGASLPQGVKVAAVGPATAQTAQQAGLPVDLIPKRSIAEGLLESFPAPPKPPGKTRVVLARAQVARAVLPEGLRAAGWEVLDVPAYQTVPASLTGRQRTEVAEADAVVFTSSSTVERLLAQTTDIPAVVASIGPATSATAVALGLTVTVEATDHTIPGVVEALCHHAASSKDG